MASKDILKLQCVQDDLARVVKRCPLFSHSVPLLKSLHWLPVQSRIIFKLCTIAYQTLSSEEPSYPSAENSLRLLFNLLSVPRVKTHAGTHQIA